MDRGADNVVPFPVRPVKRLLGQVLVDGGFVSAGDLARAIEEQARTGEKLGEVLVRLGFIEPGELSAVLAVQEDLASFERAVAIAAGERERIGELLVEAGRIRPADLEEALEEQRRTGQKVGEILVARGHVTRAEIEAVLAFQKRQAGELPASEQLRLGELLVRLNRISRDQLNQALDRQRLTGKRLGELLVEAGLAKPQDVSKGLAVQKKLVTAALVAAMSLAVAGSGPREGIAAERSGRPGAASARIEVRATVAARTTVNVLRQVPTLVVTNADVARGYVEVADASRIEVRSNRPDGYFLAFDVAPGLVRAVTVRGLGRDVQVEPGGALVEQPPARRAQVLDLSFRFQLADGARPGTYAWPVSISTPPI